MLLHIDASKHAWFGDGRYYDLITLLDDDTSEIYYAQLVAEEGTRTLMPAVREVIAQFERPDEIQKARHQRIGAIHFHTCTQSSHGQLFSMVIKAAAHARTC